MALIELEELKYNSVKIILNDPDNLNAMSEEMAKEFLQCVEKIKENKDLRAAVITGSGRAFSAGGNLKMLEAKTRLGVDENRKIMLNFYNSFLSILNLKVPLIAAINGHAIGAGLCLASACDIRISAKGAKLGFSFTKLGLHPGMGATFFLPRIIGNSTACELLYSGKVIEAEEALKIGLVSRTTDNLEAECEKIISEIVSNGPQSISMLCETLRSPVFSELPSALEKEAINQAYCYASPEFKEGISAAIEKRKAAFSLS